MKKMGIKLFFYITSLLASSIMALTAGCASGGYKLTRQYAGWVNSQSTLIRIILYILTIPVYVLTLTIDAVVFNTMDFWDGRISAGNFEFKDNNKTYQVKHEFLPGTKLRHSTIRVFDSNKNQLQETVLNETTTSEIELFVDGKLRSKVRSIDSVPVAATFDKNGKIIENKTLWFVTPMTTAKLMAKH